MKTKPAGWIVAVGATLLWAAMPAAQEGRTHGRFAFAAGTCEEPAGDCQTRGPKAWTGDEALLVSAALDAIVAKPLGRLVLDRVAVQGVTTLRRFAGGGALPKDPVGVESAAQVDKRLLPHTIDIHDQYFTYRGVHDRFSGKPGYLLTAEILLHECFHVLDDGAGSLAMARMVGFGRTGTGWRFSILTAEDALVFSSLSAAAERARAGDRSVDVLGLNRSLALKLRPTRVPSLQATHSPAEAFAESGAHLVLDPRARTYLPADIVAYFDPEVFVPGGPARRVE